MSDSIDRQAAIDAALSAADDWDSGCNKSRDKYITNALLDLPSVHPKLPENWWKTDHGYVWLCPHCGLPVHSDFEECLRCGIKRQSAQPERKKGKWIQAVKHYQDDEQGFDYIETTCSVCGVKKRIGGTGANFCPNCGAKMEVEHD